jgi:outer membrane lipoprotein-sorting protein
MKKWASKKILFMSAMMFASLIAVEPGHSQTWASVKEAFGKIRSIKAEFLQERHLRILKYPLISEGRFFYLASGSLRWEYLSPLQSVMLQKGDRIRLYHFSDGAWKQDRTQGVEARRMVLAEMSQWFRGRFEESKSFSLSYSQGPPGRIHLIPKEGIDRFILGIEIVLSDKPGVIDRVEILEPDGSGMGIKFRQVEINSSLPVELFEEP